MRALFRSLRLSSPAILSENEVLACEMRELDIQDPLWDRASRITTAAGAIKRGVPASILDVIYGAQILDAARALLAQQAPLP